jgi:putative DNA primase/helicase
VVTVPRSCIFTGTTNADEFLSDETGNRRFWPVRVAGVDLDRLAEWRDMVWAEAVALFRSGEKWWLVDEEEDLLGGAHEAHRVHDAWEDRVVEWAEGFTAAFTTGDVLSKCLEKPMGNWNRADEMRVARILKTAGWLKKTDPNHKSGGKRWFR